MGARLIHPVVVTLRPVTADSDAPPTVTLPAQVAWRRHGEAGFHAHAPTTLHGGTLTFSASQVASLLGASSLVQAAVLTIGGWDYKHAGLVINHIVPFGHWGGAPCLLKAFFASEVIADAPESLAVWERQE